MKQIAPNYYKKFNCIAGNCKDSCCQAGWEIDIDDKTASFYKSIDGGFGDKLNKNIDFTPPAHFKQKNKNSKLTCPFLNDEKLCEIYINLGEEHLCQICKDHPRYFEWFKNTKEVGIGLCCEEAARIILTETEHFSVIESEITPTETDIINSSFEYDTEIYNYLLTTRKEIIDYLENTSISISSRLRNVLRFGNIVGQNVDNYVFGDEEILQKSIQGPSATATSATQKNPTQSEKITTVLEIINFLKTLEPNDTKWPDYLEKSASIFKESYGKFSVFENSNPEIDGFIKNIAIYFIWRYLLKATFDEEVFSKIKLMYVSCLILKVLFFCKWVKNGTLTLDDCINIVKKYSEEIEYSEENIEAFADASYDLECLSFDNLLQLGRF